MHEAAAHHPFRHRVRHSCLANISARVCALVRNARFRPRQETKKEEEARKAKGEVESTESKYSRERTEAEKKEDRLRQAIQEWESKNKEIRELHYFWVAGLIALVLGMVIYERMERWTGFALVILAFCEMIWATTLSFHYFLSNNHEFDRLLTQKFLFSAVSIILLLVAWVWLRKQDRRREAAEMLRS